MISARIKKFLIPILRKNWLRWTARQNVIKQARVERGSYQCNICKQVGFKRQQLHVDHINPVVSVEDGFQSLDEFVSRLYVDEHELQALCLTCHEIKTNTENKMRQFHKDEKKSLTNVKKKVRVIK